TEGFFDFAAVTDRRSDYYDRFQVGATLFPRCFFFVEPARDAALNLETPFLRTSDDAWDEAKEQWRLKCEGKVEKEFLFGTVLAKHLIPFVVRQSSLVVLPIKEDSHGDLKMIGPLDALGDGFTHAHDWFLEVERIWNKKRKNKGQTIQQRLNYNHLLSNQDPHHRLIVLYNAAGTNLSAALLTTKECRAIAGLAVRGFI